MTLSERIWRKIKKAGANECWLYTGRKDKWGYGDHLVRVGPREKSKFRHVLVHRFVYEEVNGALPSHLMVRHTCNNPPCCNPAHLQSGTHRDNMDDMIKAGSRKGEKNPSAILTKEDVIEIRKARSSGSKLKELATKYGVTVATIWAVCNKTWSSVEQR